MIKRVKQVLIYGKDEKKVFIDVLLIDFRDKILLIQNI